MSGSLGLAGVVATQWTWSFGDGTTGFGQTVQKTYTAPGTYTVMVQVQTNQGLLSNTTTATITGGAVPGATETVFLSQGCNNVAITWPSGTAPSTIVAAVAPSTAVVAIWRYDAPTQRFLGYAPTAPLGTSDLPALNRLEAAYICTTSPGTLTRPVVA
jgi:hypothetical protein